VISRVVVPSQLGSARDPRTLGVALRQIMLWQGPRVRVIEAADASLRDGFHGFEPLLGARWTCGAARLPAALFDGLTGSCQLELRVGCTARYPRRHYRQLAA
jgi:hypothetical protein